MSKPAILILASILAIISSPLHGQGDDDHIVWTGWEKYNLKGKVKEYEVNFDRFYSYETVDSNTSVLAKEFRTQQLYEVRNYFRRNKVPMGSARFDTLGLEKFHFPIARDSLVYSHIISVKKASHTEIYLDYDSEEIKTKMEMEGIYQPFPVHSPYRIYPSEYVLSITIDSAVSALDSDYTVLYTYDVDSMDRIANELYSMRINMSVNNRDERNGNLLRNDTVPEFKLIRLLNSFDSKGRIIRQDIVFREDMEPQFRLFERARLHSRSGLESGIDDRVFYEYGYDEQDRITKAHISENGRVIWQEEYEYVGNSRRPIKLNRFVQSARTSISTFYSDYSTEWFNDKGDITKSENYNREKELVRTCFYEYEYDEVGNWTRCDMYLEGGDQKTEKPTIRVNREIIYYE